MRLAWAVVIAIGVSACGGKAEPTARERVAAVLDKDQAPKKVAAEPAKNVAPDPAAPKADPASTKLEPKAEPLKVETKPEPAKVETKPEPAKVEPAKTEPITVAKTEPSEPAAKVEPAKVEPTEPYEPTGEPMYSLTVNDAALTLGIDNRFPTERKTSFVIGTDAKVYAWFEFKNSGVPADVAFVWKKAGKETWRIAVNVGAGKNWRTWAEKKIGKRDAGAWTVQVIDEAGHVYETLSYDVTGT